MKKIFIVLLLVLFVFGCAGEDTAINDASLETKDTQQMSKYPTVEEQVESEGQKAKLLYPDVRGADRGEMQTPPKPQTDIRYFKFLSSKTACEILSKVFPEAVFAQGDRADMVIIKARKDDIDGIASLSQRIDVALSQVMIESSVVEITESGLKTLGLQWASSSGSTDFRFSLDAKKSLIESDGLAATLSALIASGKARIIARPRITTLDNTEASVNIGSRIPYAVPASTTSSGIQWAVQYIDAGVSLKITPKISADKMISVEIHPEVSSVSQWRTTVAGEFPVISTRNAAAFVRVKNGETIVIAGLIDEKDRDNIQKLPYAGDIPFISELFTKRISEKEKTEIIFLITPKIV